MRTLALSLVLSACSTPTAGAGLEQVPSPELEPLGVWFGYSLARLGDVDGDGAGDFAVGSPLGTGGGRGRGYAPGRVAAISGATGSVLYVVAGPAGLGEGLAQLDDLDRDGVSELAVMGWSSQEVVILSGATGEMVHLDHWDKSWWEQQGAMLTSIPDVDGDGVGDLLMGRPHSIGVEIYSGADGRELMHTTSDEFLLGGELLLGLDDVDGDDSGDFAYGRATFVDVGVADTLPTTEIVVASGRTGLRLYSFSVSRPSIAAELRMCRVGDLDSDEVGDYAIAATRDLSRDGCEPGLVELRSGRNGELLRILEGPHAASSFGYSIDYCPEAAGRLLVTQYAMGLGGMPDDESMMRGRLYEFDLISGERTLRTEESVPFGRSVLALSDVNGDGMEDYAIGTTPDDAGDFQQGWVSVYSGATNERLYRVPPE